MPEDIEIGQPQGLTGLSEGFVKGLKSSPGCAVHERKGHHEGSQYSSIPVHDNPDADFLQRYSQRAPAAEQEEQKVPNHRGGKHQGKSEDHVQDAL